MRDLSSTGCCPTCGGLLPGDTPQLSLAPVAPERKSRRGDPATARSAAVRAVPNAGTQGWRIALALRDGPGTYEDLSARTGIRGVTVSTRLSDLRKAGWIEDRGTRRTSAGSPAVLVALTAAGRAELDREPVAA